MIVILSTTAYNAARKVKQARKQTYGLPVLDCIHLYHHEGRFGMTTTNLDKPLTEYIPCLWHGETWETCVPARPFIDWLKATQPNKEDKAYHRSERMELDFCPITQTLKITAGNTRAEFKCIDAQEFPPI